MPALPEPRTTTRLPGELSDSGAPAAGPADFRFTLFDAETDGLQIGAPLELLDVELTGGRFTVILDFGQDVFDGAPRYLEIEARHPAGAGEFIFLAPRQADAIPTRARETSCP